MLLIIPTTTYRVPGLGSSWFGVIGVVMAVRPSSFEDRVHVSLGLLKSDPASES